MLKIVQKLKSYAGAAKHPWILVPSYFPILNPDTALNSVIDATLALSWAVVVLRSLHGYRHPRANPDWSRHPE